MSGQMDKCIACGEMVFYADEKVVGTWNGMPYDRFDVLSPEEYQNGVPEGYLVYCLDCAPCECGFHPPFMSDKQAREDGWCFSLQCPPASGPALPGAHRHLDDGTIDW